LGGRFFHWVMDGSIPKPSGQRDNKPVVIPKLPRASLAKREASARHSFSSFLACQSQQSSQLDDIYAACLDKRENWSNLGDSLKNGVSIEELKYDLVAMMVVFVICEIFTCNVVIIISLSSTPTLLNRPILFVEHLSLASREKYPGIPSPTDFLHLL